MGNAPAHPPGLEDDLLGEFSFIAVKFFAPNTTPLFRPRDQQVISNFKKLYTQVLAEVFWRNTDDTQESSELTM